MQTRLKWAGAMFAAAILTVQTSAAPSFSIEARQHAIEPGPLSSQSAIFRITRGGTNTSGSVTINFTVSGYWGGTTGVAEYDVDYHLSGPYGENQQTGVFTVSYNLSQPYLDIYAAPIHDLVCDEPNETIAVTLQAGSGYTLGSPSSASTYLVNQNIRGHHVLNGGLYAGNGRENGGTIYRIILRRSCGNPPNSGDYWASYHLSGTANTTPGQTDYTISGSTLIPNLSAETYIYLHVQDDPYQEGTEYIYASRDWYEPITAVFSIFDDESCEPYAPVVTAKAGHQIVRLSWNAIPNAQSYKVKRAEYSNGTLSDYSVIGTLNSQDGFPPATNYDDGTARNGVAYSYVVTTVGGTCGTPRESGPSAPVERTPTETRATLTAVPGTLVEGGGPVKFRVTLDPPVEADTDINVRWAWDAWGYTIAQWYYDFESSGAPGLKVPGGQSFAEFTITPKEDTASEPREAIVYELNGGYYLAMQPWQAVHWLYDNDPGEPPVHNVYAGNNQVLVTWPSHPGANTYRLVRTQGGSTVTLLNNAPNTVTSYLDEAVVNGTTYTYILYATTAGGTTQSIPLSGTPQNTLGGSGAFSGNNFVITITGAMLNKQCAVEYSDDGVKWEWLNQNVQLTTSGNSGTATGTVQDTSVANKVTRYYRFRSGSPIDGTTAVTSPNILAFQRITLPPKASDGSGGFALVGVQLQSPNNTLSQFVPYPYAPNGTQVYLWNEQSQAYDVYTRTGGLWYLNGVQANPALPLGTAFFMKNPLSTSFTFNVIGTAPASGGTVTTQPAAYSMRAALSPQAAWLPQLGLTPTDGTRVYRFNKATQNWETHTFDDLIGNWSPSAPWVEPGEGVYIWSPSSFQWTHLVVNSALSTSMESAGAIKVKLTGPWYQNETIQTSLDLASWSAWQTVNSGSRQVEVTVADVSTPARFFRVHGSGRRSSKAVGYYKVWVPGQTGGGYGGWVMAANQLDSLAVGTAAANTLQSVLPSVQAGLKAHKWNETIQAWDTYENPTGWQWQRNGAASNTSFTPGETMFFQNPGATGFYLIFFGQVPEGSLSVTIPAGQSYRAGALPMQIEVESDWTFPTQEGMNVQVYSSAAQNYQSHTFSSLNWAWSPSPPVFKRGEGFALQYSPSTVDWKKFYIPWQ